MIQYDVKYHKLRSVVTG